MFSTSPAVDTVASPPPSPRAPLSSPETTPPDHPGVPPPHPPLHPSAPNPIRTPSAATTSTAASRPRTRSPYPTAATAPAHGRHNAAHSLRAQTLTRLAGRGSSTPRARLARGGPPRVSVRGRPPDPPPPPPPTLVRYHWSTIIILVLYLPLLIVPWVIVCILDFKPLTWHGASYETAGWYTSVSLSLSLSLPSASERARFVMPDEAP